MEKGRTPIGFRQPHRWLLALAGTMERRGRIFMRIPITLRRAPPRKPMRRMAPLHPAGEGHWCGRADDFAQEQRMLDVFMVALGLGFFVAAVGYAYACERL